MWKSSITGQTLPSKFGNPGAMSGAVYASMRRDGFIFLETSELVALQRLSPRLELVDILLLDARAAVERLLPVS